jgi:hypothetical protein
MSGYDDGGRQTRMMKIPSHRRLLLREEVASYVGLQDFYGTL